MVQLLRDHMCALKSVAPRMTARQAVEIAPATVGLAAACLNAAISPGDPRQPAGVALARTAIVRHFIEQNLHVPGLTAAWIAGRVGLSRSKLNDLFEAPGGVASYIRERRLRRALLALTDRRRRQHSVYEIAFMSGYANDAAFVRAFRGRYGVTPNDVRISGAVPIAPRRPQPGGDRRHEDWVRHLSVYGVASRARHRKPGKSKASPV